MVPPSLGPGTLLAATAADTSAIEAQRSFCAASRFADSCCLRSLKDPNCESIHCCRAVICLSRCTVTAPQAPQDESRLAMETREPLGFRDSRNSMRDFRLSVAWRSRPLRWDWQRMRS